MRFFGGNTSSDGVRPVYEPDESFIMRGAPKAYGANSDAAKRERAAPRRTRAQHVTAGDAQAQRLAENWHRNPWGSTSNQENRIQR